MQLTRRGFSAATLTAAGAIAGTPLGRLAAQSSSRSRSRQDLTIKEVRVTPIALPDPPLLAASGCHGPYFLRTIVEVVTTEGLSGFGETGGGQRTVAELQRAAPQLAGHSALAWRTLVQPPLRLGPRAYAAVEVACLDVIGKASGLKICELLGGPVRPDPEFAAYLFFRYAADDPRLLADPRIVDDRGRGKQALDPWGEVRTPEAMAELAWQFHQRFGFTVHKLKAGVLPPAVEREALAAISARFGGRHKVRIDPNARWSVETAINVGRELVDLPLEYYEDPVRGQEAMAEVRRRTKLPMSTNMCVVAMDDIPPAIRTQPVDVVLADHHYWGGFAGCLALDAMAATLSWKLSQHSNSHTGVSMAAMIHLAALLPQLVLASDTHYPWLVEGTDILVGGKLPIVEGRMRIPPGPGLGVEVDRDQLARAAEVYRKCPIRDRDDAATMRLVEPGWQRTIF